MKVKIISMWLCGALALMVSLRATYLIGICHDLYFSTPNFDLYAVFLPLVGLSFLMICFAVCDYVNDLKDTRLGDVVIHETD
jgi:hypothetical protein